MFAGTLLAGLETRTGSRRVEFLLILHICEGFRLLFCFVLLHLCLSLSSHISFRSHMFSFVEVRLKLTVQFVFLFSGPSRDSYVSVTPFFVVIWI